MASVNREDAAGWRCVWGILILAVGLFLCLALFSYDWGDIRLLRVPPNRPPSNLIGPVGAWVSFALLVLLGVGAFLVPAWCMLFGLLMILDRRHPVWPRVAWCAVFMIAIGALLELGAAWWAPTCARLNIVDAGGVLCRLLARDILVRSLGPVGTGILVWAVCLFSGTMLIGVRHLRASGAWMGGALREWTARTRDLRTRRSERPAMATASPDRGESRREQKRQEQRERQRQREEERAVRAAAAAEAAPAVERPLKVPAKPAVREVETRPAPVVPEKAASSSATESRKANYQFPSKDMLQLPAPGTDTKIQTDTSVTAKLLVDTLADFGIEAEVTNAERGPVVTRYEVLPAPGIRVERIAGLQNNLALALKATSVRVQAPIPGKGVVGIEVPNETSKIVYLREVLEGEQWNKDGLRIPLALGQDVGGNDLVADLARMPHLLIAGATGSGKTVCMNSILAGLLMSRTPDELRLMLVDPKIVEFSQFNELPHLVVPVITDPKKVALGLRWAINEMERRYKLFAKAGVRNIETFNHREIVTQEDLFEGKLGGTDKKPDMPDRVPYVVIIIDELADLMLAAQAEIENCIARLAQLSRAVGIHMIIATQRPSVNVITGTIKANFPARIAFQVAQKVDSRTILDTVGADKLLGQGDMLFLPPGTSKLVRAQGAMTTDKEIHEIVEFIKQQGAPEYEVEIKEKLDRSAGSGAEGGGDLGGDDGVDDTLLAQAIEIIRETRRASTSSLQRRLRIGYNRAGRIMDLLEERGIVGPPRGSDPREILIDLDGEIPKNESEPGDEAAAPGDEA